VNLLGTRSQHRPGALVDRGTRRVHVVDERHRAGPCTSGEGIAHIAPAVVRVETALRPHAARAAHERHDRQIPPASELHGELRGRVGPALQPPVAHRRHDRDRLDTRTRQLVGDERPGQSRR